MGLNPVKTSMLEESVAMLRELMAGRHARSTTPTCTCAGSSSDPAIPIMMPATGPKNLRAAGALADRVMLYVGVDESSVRWAIDHVRAGAEEAGRDPDAVKLRCSRAMWVGDDQEEAWNRCRWAPAACANHIADTMRRNTAHGMPETMTRLPQSRDDYDYYEGHLSSDADHTAYLTGELIDDFAIAGSADKVRAKVQELFGLGIDEISCAYLNGNFDQMDTVGREIIAAVATQRLGGRHGMKRIGVDVGGTFTDLILVDEESGRITVDKVPSTPDDPARGVVDGIRRLCDKADVDLSQIDNLLHGTTVATNIALTHSGAEVGMITTEGMRDILHIARHKKPLNFSLQQELPWQSRPLVKRRHRLTVKERVTVPHGDVLVPLDEDEVRERVRAARAAGVEAVAVCFLHSYLNPAHEQRVKEILLEEFPEAYLSVSNEVLPLYREFERFSTVALNAYVGPKVSRYVARFDDAMREAGFSHGVQLMQSSGGMATGARRRSGPSTCSCQARSRGSSAASGQAAWRVSTTWSRSTSAAPPPTSASPPAASCECATCSIRRSATTRRWCPWSTSTRLAPAAARSRTSTRAACSASAPSPPVPTRGRRATGGAARCRPPRTRSSSWAASAPTAGFSAEQWRSTATLPSRR